MHLRMRRQLRDAHALRTCHAHATHRHAHSHAHCHAHAHARAHAVLQACEMCMVDKPPRAKHCYDCGRCVRRMDHHCWWLGNCVGERTHRRFLYFLGAQALLLWWTCAAAVAGVVSVAHDEGAAPEGATTGEAAPPIPPRVPQSLTLAAGVVVALFTLVIGLAALTLLVFQLALMLRPTSPYISLHLPTSPYISLHLPTSPLHLPISPRRSCCAARPRGST